MENVKFTLEQFSVDGDSVKYKGRLQIRQPRLALGTSLDDRHQIPLA